MDPGSCGIVWIRKSQFKSVEHEVNEFQKINIKFIDHGPGPGSGSMK